MSKTAMNLQDSFLNQVRRENSEVRVLLVNGTVLRGVVRGFDNFTVILNSRNGRQHLIYKHAIAQLVNQRGAKREGEEVTCDKEERCECLSAVPEPAAEVNAKPKKQGFNMLDLSHVKLPEEQQVKVPE